MSLVSKLAPLIRLYSLTADNNIVYSTIPVLSTLIGEKPKWHTFKFNVLFFYPANFTFVCPTELIELNNRIKEFTDRNVNVMTVSNDSVHAHRVWKEMEGGIGQVQFDMVADTNHELTKAYGVQHDSGVPLRAVFIIDSKGVVRAEIVNDLGIGRNIDEVLRLIDAIEFHDKHGEVCPIGWQKGDKGMQATPEGVKDYLHEGLKKYSRTLKALEGIDDMKDTSEGVKEDLTDKILSDLANEAQKLGFYDEINAAIDKHSGQLHDIKGKLGCPNCTINELCNRHSWDITLQDGLKDDDTMWSGD